MLISGKAMESVGIHLAKNTHTNLQCVWGHNPVLYEYHEEGVLSFQQNRSAKCFFNFTPPPSPLSESLIYLFICLFTLLMSIQLLYLSVSNDLIYNITVLYTI